MTDSARFFSKVQYFSYFAVYFGDLFLNVKTGHYDSPLFNGYVIVSESMVPTIQINDAIVIKREKDQNYQVGDIISFYSTEYNQNGIVVTHRIIDKKNVTKNQSNYRTKGDHNSRADRSIVGTPSIYGKVLFIIPKLGNFQKFISDPLHFSCCIIIPAVIVILYDIFRILKAFRQRREFS